MIATTHIINTINKHLQKNVEFIVENKTIKSGRVLLFSIKDFFCCFLLFNEIKKKRFLYEIPYPFLFCEIDNDEIIFDYTTNSFLANNPTTKQDLLKFRNKKPSKLFNKKVKLKIHI